MVKISPNQVDGDREFEVRRPGARPKHSFKKAEALREDRQYLNKTLSSNFINLGKTEAPIEYSTSHIYGAHLAQELRHILETTELRQVGDNADLEDHKLRELKLREIAESFLTVAPTQFVTTLLKVLGLEQHIGQMKSNRKLLLETFFRPLKDSFRRFLDPEKTQINDKWAAITAKIKKELKAPSQSKIFTKDISEKLLRQVRHTWTNNNSNKPLAA